MFMKCTDQVVETLTTDMLDPRNLSQYKFYTYTIHVLLLLPVWYLSKVGKCVQNEYGM